MGIIVNVAAAINWLKIVPEFTTKFCNPTGNILMFVVSVIIRTHMKEFWLPRKVKSAPVIITGIESGIAIVHKNPPLGEKYEYDSGR